MNQLASQLQPTEGGQDIHRMEGWHWRGGSTSEKNVIVSHINNIHVKFQPICIWVLSDITKETCQIKKQTGMDKI